MEGNGQDIGLLGASQVGDVCVKRHSLLGSGGLCNCHGDTENGVGTELLLVLGSVELVQEGVDSRLVLDINFLLDQSRGNGVVDVGDSLGDALATPFGLVSIAELASLVGASGRTRRNDGTVKPGLGDDVNLDGGVALEAVSSVVNPWLGEQGVPTRES